MVKDLAAHMWLGDLWWTFIWNFISMTQLSYGTAKSVVRLPHVCEPALCAAGQVRSPPGVLEGQHSFLAVMVTFFMVFTLNLIKTSLLRVIHRSSPCWCLLGNFLNNFLSWLSEEKPPPSLHSVEVSSGSFHWCGYGLLFIPRPPTGLKQAWDKPHCD